MHLILAKVRLRISYCMVIGRATMMFVSLVLLIGGCGVKISKNRVFTLFNTGETPIHAISSTALSFHCHCAKN